MTLSSLRYGKVRFSNLVNLGEPKLNLEPKFRGLSKLI